jgi:hypothetical protein
VAKSGNTAYSAFCWTARYKLQHCLHAPDAPINLFSVEALNKGHLTVAFVPGGPTKISYPILDPILPGFTFLATVIGHLLFLTLDFVLPPSVKASAKTLSSYFVVFAYPSPILYTACLSIPYIISEVGVGLFLLGSGSRMDDSGLRRRIPKGLGLSLCAVPS